MPQGLQVFDQFGNLKVDVSDRLMRFLGYVVVSSSGTLTHDGFLTGVPFAIANMYSNNSGAYMPGEGLYPIDVSFSGNVMTYTLQSFHPTQVIQYGVR